MALLVNGVGNVVHEYIFLRSMLMNAQITVSLCQLSLFLAHFLCSLLHSLLRRKPLAPFYYLTFIHTQTLTAQTHTSLSHSLF